MRFTTGILFGVFVVRPIASKVYSPFKPMVEEVILDAARSFGYAMAEKVRSSLFTASDKLRNEGES